MKGLCAFLISVATATSLFAAENDYYRLSTIPVPDHIKLEVSGLALLPDGRLAAANRRGEIWFLDGVHDAMPTNVTYKLFASGLHEPLGLAWRDGSLYTVQRSELTRLRDTNADDGADEYLTVAKGWGLTGNYHEYAYGPVFDHSGNAWLTLNCTIGNPIGTNDAWRGWSLKVDASGKWQPVSGGFRSPSGVGLNAAGDVFASEQQGNWFAAGALLHIQPGVFHGHASALKFCDLPGATFKKPESVPQNLTVVEAAKTIPALELPAVWLPYRKMGMSVTDILCNTNRAKFGPFEDQLFIGEFTMSAVNRVFLEKIKGKYQGACFPFRKQLQSATVRLAWGRDGSLFVGQNNRGWNSLGTRSYGLQRLSWTGKMPFEIKTMEAKSDGFLLTFTQPLSRDAAQAVSSYGIRSYTYPYHSNYGGEELDVRTLAIDRIEVSPDLLSAQLIVDGLRAGYVHELRATGVKSSYGGSLVHDSAFYTLNQIP